MVGAERITVTCQSHTVDREESWTQLLQPAFTVNRLRYQARTHCET